MSEISLKKFVDINIQPHITSVVKGTRDTVVLFTNENGNIGDKTVIGITDTNIKLIDSQGIQTEISGSTIPNTFAYLKVYFNNGGAKVKVIENKEYSDLTVEDITNLSNEYICITYAAPVKNIEDVYAKLKSIAKSNENNVYGIDEKLILSSTKVFTDSEDIKNFIVKYSNIQGAEMTVAAYLSKINVYGIDTVQDYAFTQEIIEEEKINDSQFTTILENNENVDIYLANKVRNCGGNCKDGSDITNSFVRILLHQTLTEKLLNLLVTKIKNSTGLGKIYTTISQELENYLNSGYLTTDKIWTDEDLIITKNNITYSIITKGTALTNGYHITILPLSSLTEEEIADRKTPPIYVIIADQYGIRTITVNGEVI